MNDSPQKWIDAEFACLAPPDELVRDFVALLQSPAERTIFFRHLMSVSSFAHQSGAAKDDIANIDAGVAAVIAALSLGSAAANKVKAMRR